MLSLAWGSSAAVRAPISLTSVNQKKFGNVAIFSSSLTISLILARMLESVIRSSLSAERNYCRLSGDEALE